MSKIEIIIRIVSGLGIIKIHTPIGVAMKPPKTNGMMGSHSAIRAALGTITIVTKTSVDNVFRTASVTVLNVR